ncbi:hypothetical protein A6456_33935 [Paraburkholderia tropica]|nr:hypothetical protein A6456_33935 [Paraburkholderia tropica]
MTGEAWHAGSVNRALLGCATRAERKVENNGTHTPLAIASLVFLVAVHKLEYFANARIVGQRIEARAWELLIVMVGMEALFGLWGGRAGPTPGHLAPFPELVDAFETGAAVQTTMR